MPASLTDKHAPDKLTRTSGAHVCSNSSQGYLALKVRISHQKLGTEQVTDALLAQVDQFPLWLYASLAPVSGDLPVTVQHSATQKQQIDGVEKRRLGLISFKSLCSLRSFYASGNYTVLQGP